MQGVLHGAAIMQGSLPEFASEENSKDEDELVLDMNHPAAFGSSRSASAPEALQHSCWPWQMADPASCGVNCPASSSTDRLKDVLDVHSR